MSGADNLCDVCHVNPMIGVASTRLPYSCAYCRECAFENAQPEWIFEYFSTPDCDYYPSVTEGLVTYKDGKYLTYEEWKMVISGRGSSRDIEQALQTIKNNWETTHEVSKNKEGSPEGFNPIVGQNTNGVGEGLQGLVPETD